MADGASDEADRPDAARRWEPAQEATGNDVGRDLFMVGNVGRDVIIGTDNSGLAQDAARERTGGSFLSHPTFFGGLALAALLAIAVPGFFYVRGELQDGDESAKGASTPSRDVNGGVSNPKPKPAPSASPPLQVESITELANNGDAEAVDFVVPAKLSMTKAELTRFNGDVVPDSKALASWYTTHRGAAIEGATTTITLRGNRAQEIRLTGMTVVKDCRRPYAGTYFVGYTQGGAEQNIGVAFNLDHPHPIPQSMARTSGRGLFPLGTNYFADNTVKVGPGETVALAINVYTKRYSCSFSLQLIVATAEGAFTQTIDDHGRPFIITAKAPPAQPGKPLSGYQAVYADKGQGYVPVDPAAYTAQ